MTQPTSTNGAAMALAPIAEPQQRQLTRLTADVPGIEKMLEQVREIQARVLRPDVDYGVIPGTGSKPCLLKPGAESLIAAFGLGVGRPATEIVPIEHEIAGHREYRMELPVINRANGEIVGYGVGSCSTMEAKYRFRQGERKCPACGKAAIIKGKAEYGGGWLCFGKKGGCGAKYPDGSVEIEGQNVGQTENTNPADQYNTVLKMCKKRALVDAALTTTAASGIFTQDVEEFPENDQHHAPPGPRQQQQQTQARPPAQTQRQARSTATPGSGSLATGQLIKVDLSEGIFNANDNVYRWRARDEKGNSDWIWCYELDKAKAACRTDFPEDSTATVLVQLKLNTARTSGKQFYEVADMLPADTSDFTTVNDDELQSPITDAPTMAGGAG